MTRIGTPLYCAPEVLNNEHYSTKVDIYSYAMLTYAMVSGQAPWKEQNLGPVQIMMKVARKERPEIPKNTHPQITGLITKCWGHNPDERPDATQIIQILESCKPSKELQSATDATILLPTVVIPPVNNSNTTTTKPTYSSNISMSIDGKPRCIYDSVPGGCYQKSLSHGQQFSHPLRSYKNYCLSYLKNGTISLAEKELLRQYRTTQGINKDYHNLAIIELQWTLEEFEQGKKK